MSFLDVMFIVNMELVFVCMAGTLDNEQSSAAQSNLTVVDTSV